MIRQHPWTALVALATLAACAYPDDSDCDPDQVLTNGNCVAASSGGAPGAGGVPGTAGAAGAGGAIPLPEGYGVPCANADGCTAPADFCTTSPFSPDGYCTSSGCTGDPDCPDGMTCFDLGIAQVPPFCVVE